MPRRLDIFAALLLSVLAVRSAAAQNYGGTDQVLTVDASAFLGFGADAYEQSDGYVYMQNVGELNGYTPLPLPDGAVITQICMYARNEDISNVVDLSLQAVKLATAGQSPAVVTIPGSLIVSNFHDGYHEQCTSPLSYEVHEMADIDGDQNPELIAHRLWTFVPYGTYAIGGARITWHRQVSPPPAVATFPDVPTNHPFFQFVEALHAAGIAAGYGNGSFGVNDAITRGQMAVFLAKALGLHWAN
jgi:hypothetical protein